MDELKKSVRDLAFGPFFEGRDLNVNHLGYDVGYEVSHVENLEIMIRVPGDHGPRYFSIKVTERV